MIVLRSAVFVAGLLIAGWTVVSALRTTVLPRSAQVAISRFLFRMMRVVFQFVAGLSECLRPPRSGARSVRAYQSSGSSDRLDGDGRGWPMRLCFGRSTHPHLPMPLR